MKYEDYLEGTRKVLEASQRETEPYHVDILGRQFVVLSNVFSPKYFFDTELFAEHLPIVQGEDVLEIGSGTGAISITAAYRGARRVLAIDVNPVAIQNTAANIVAHNFQETIEARLGDVYDSLKLEEKFDTIFWNTPFGFLGEQQDVSDIEKSVYDPGYKATERFIKEAKAHLKQRGRVLIGFSTTLGRFDLLQKFVDEVGMDLQLLFEVESTETHPVKFEIFEAIPKN